MVTPAVSVIMPAFNAAPWIDRAIRSVLAQTFTDWELIVMDDGSVDETAAQIIAFAERDSRIRYFYQPNQGQGIARKHAIEQSSSPWIALLDADDYWLPERLQTGMEALKVSGAQCLFSSALVWHEKNPAPEEGMRLEAATYQGAAGMRWLLRQNSIPALTTLFSRAAYDRAGGFGTRRLAEDYELWLRMMATGACFQSLPQPLAVYYWHATASSAGDHLLGEDCMEVFRQLARDFPEHQSAIREAMVYWIEEKLCPGATATTRYAWYVRLELLPAFSKMIFQCSAFLPGRVRGRMLPLLAGMGN